MSFLLHSINITWTGCCHMSQALLSIYGTFITPRVKMKPKNLKCPKCRKIIVSNKEVFAQV